MSEGGGRGIIENMYPVARFLYEQFDYQVAGYLLYLVIFLLAALVYKLGFAKKLRLGQNIVIYLFLAIGCLILTFLAFGLPIVEGLMIAALILILYKIRLRNEKKEAARAK